MSIFDHGPYPDLDDVTREAIADAAERVADSLPVNDDRGGVPAMLRAEERAADWREFARQIRNHR